MLYHKLLHLHWLSPPKIIFIVHQPPAIPTMFLVFLTINYHYDNNINIHHTHIYFPTLEKTLNSLCVRIVADDYDDDRVEDMNRDLEQRKTFFYPFSTSKTLIIFLLLPRHVVIRSWEQEKKFPIAISILLVFTEIFAVSNSCFNHYSTVFRLIFHYQ